ncbi:glycosyl hydrolase family 28-related protein [uncultured Aquimarina sp.]|uniref:glycosyl hydrolase family 28-related protein n=1 Tax=uncultured Aquimarina sp. TaxID=575652 RepID=UPI0026364312|nr:glycosyl hydrolase family 28-related protein [uncultured Aquimarina sp.]
MFSFFLSLHTFSQQSIRFPVDARVMDVTTMGVDNTGSRDSTAELQSVIDSVQNLQFGQIWLYFPKGTYLISDALVAERFITFQGENKDETIIRLVDNALGYEDASSRKNMLKIGLSVNESFDVFVNDLTFDVGNGNPAAVALDFQAHNMGAVRNVKFIGRAESGKIGLQIQRLKNTRPDWSTPGPMFIQDITVEGFEVAILIGEDTAGLTHVTLENIEISNQRIAGVELTPRLNVSLRNFKSNNLVSAIKIFDSFGSTMALMDTEMIGGSLNNSAILTDGDSSIYLHNVKAEGYKSVVEQAGNTIPGMRFEDWSSDKPESLFESPDVTLGLPIKETPTYFNNDFSSDWQPVNSNNDIQSALNSGKPVVYLSDKGDPNFNIFSVTNTITIPSSVRWFHLMGHAIGLGNWQGGENPVFIIEGSSSDPPLIIERMNYNNQQTIGQNIVWLHRGSRTVVFKDCKGRYKAEPGAGDVFFEDYVSSKVEFVEGQNIWARQFNLEDAQNRPDPLVTNDGARLWILGYKTEGAKTGIKTINGGITEMIGGNFLPLEGASTAGIPLFIIEDASFSATGYQAFYTWNIHVKETRDGVTKELLKDSKVNMALYSGYKKEDVPNNDYKVIGEVGKITNNQKDKNTWYTIKLNNTYSNPVIFMGPPSYNGGQPTTVRTKNITNNSFEYQIDEWDYLDGAHITESLSYMVLESGTHKLTNGKMIMAGKVVQGLNHTWKVIDFPMAFPSTPVVLTQCASYYDGQAVVSRQRLIGQNRFQVQLQEEKANDGIHDFEDINWIAIETGIESEELQYEIVLTQDFVTHDFRSINHQQSYSDAPIFLAAIQTFDGSDPASLRYKNLNRAGVNMKVEEENSTNSGVAHTSEVIGYCTFNKPGDIFGISMTEVFNSREENVSNINVLLADNLTRALIYPNPIKNRKLNISFDQNLIGDQVQLNIIDLYGKIVLSKTVQFNNPLSLDVSGLEKGIYLLNSVIDKKQITWKVVIQ